MRPAAPKFGVLYDFRNPERWRRPFVDLYRDLLDQIATLEDLGFDSVWLTEHHFVEDGYLPSLFPVAGAIAERTRRITIGTNVLLLPLHHPVDVAESSAVVDILSGGRFVLGVALGYRVEEFRGLGVPASERGAIMEEALEIIGRCWADGPFSHAGKHFTLRDVDVHPKPLQRPGVPVWVGARGARAIDRAARMSSGWLTAGAGRTEFEAYRAACERHGRPLGTVCALKNVFVGDWSVAGPHATYMQTNYRQWYGEAADLPVDTADVRVSDRYPLPLDWYIIGDPSFVAEQIAAYREEVPFDHLVMVMHFPGMDTRTSGRSIRDFAEKVMPRLR